MSNIPFSIFPVGPHKRPLIEGWQAKATRDPHTIAQWQANGARAWGIPTGAANGLFVIDLDVDKETGERIGRDSLLAMPRYASLYDHAFVMTPSGGRHIYCQHFDGGRNTTSRIGPKIDTRGEGGYVVAPGSQVAGGFYAGSVPHTFPKVPMGLRAMLLHTPPPAPVRNLDRTTPTDYTLEQRANLTISESDLRVFMAVADAAPVNTDTLVIGGVEYVVVSVSTLGPDGVTICHDVQVRR